MIIVTRPHDREFESTESDHVFVRRSEHIFKPYDKTEIEIGIATDPRFYIGMHFESPPTWDGWAKDGRPYEVVLNLSVADARKILRGLQDLVGEERQQQ